MKRSILRVGWKAALILAAIHMILAATTASAQIEVNINGDNIGNGATLEAAINSTAIQLQDIASIEVTKGAIAETDWAWMQTQSSSLTKLVLFQANEQVAAANLNTTAFPFGSAKTVRIHNMAEVGDNALMGAANMWELDLPATTTIGVGAVKSCPKLQLVRLPKVVNIKGEAFKGCSLLKMILLGTTPPSVANASAFEELPKKRYIMFAEAGQEIDFNSPPHKNAVKAYEAADDGALTNWYEWEYNDFTTIKIDRNIQNGTLTISPAQPAYLLSRPHKERDRIDFIYTPNAGFVPTVSSYSWLETGNDGTQTEKTEEIVNGSFYPKKKGISISAQFEEPSDISITGYINDAEDLYDGTSLQAAWGASWDLSPR